jgi:hypothetical protein
MRTRTALLPTAVALAIPALALAANPKVPATYSGGGGGAPVSFKLDKHGKATSAFFVFTCKNANGAAVAKTDSKHKPSGTVSHGKITITYAAKGGGKIGTVQATLKATFTSKTHAKGTTTVSGGNCKSPSKGNFTVDATK